MTQVVPTGQTWNVLHLRRQRSASRWRAPGRRHLLRWPSCLPTTWARPAWRSSEDGKFWDACCTNRGGPRFATGSLGTQYQFTGQRAELDIYYFNARWVDPAIGRFLQADSIIPQASQGVQAWDRYAGLNNNPVMFNDPTGHDVGCAGEDASLCGPGYNLPLAPFEYIPPSQLDYNLPPATNYTSVNSSSNGFSMSLVYTPDPNFNSAHKFPSRSKYNINFI